MRLPWILALACGTFKGMCWLHYMYILLCYCINVGEDRGLVRGGWEKCWKSIVKEWLWWFHCATLCELSLQQVLVGQISEQLSSIVLLSRCRFFPMMCSFLLANSLCVTPMHATICFKFAYLLWTRSVCIHSIHVGCASKVHHNQLHVKVPIVTWQW